MANGLNLNTRNTNRQAPYRRIGKRTSVFLLPYIILAILGAGFIFFILNLQGISLLASPKKMTGNFLPSFFSPSVLYWEDDIIDWAATWDLDPLLVATVMQIESCGHPTITSPSNAQGLFQVMPFHFTPNENMLDPHINAHRGLSYLSESFQKANGDIEQTLAGYNGGHGQISQSRSYWPEETKNYATWGVGIYSDAVNGFEESKNLQRWLNAGGWRLCQQAKKALDIQ
jgi:soluble lytic murein transglycosylase-like protein